MVGRGDLESTDGYKVLVDPDDDGAQVLIGCHSTMPTGAGCTLSILRSSILYNKETGYTRTSAMPPVDTCV